MTRRAPLLAPLVFSGVAAVLFAGCGKPDNATPPAPSVAAPPAPAPVAEAPAQPPPAPAQPSAPALDDATVATRVLAALQADPETNGLDIDVKASEGAVALTGLVDSRAQTEKATSIAAAVDGVRSVDNRIDLKTGSAASAPGDANIQVAKTSDAAITSQIEGALSGDPYLGPSKVSVVTRNGEVQLSGFVPSQDQADDVMAIAHRVEGVKNVVSNLTVGQGEPE